MHLRMGQRSVTRHRNKKQLNFRVRQGQFPSLSPGELLLEQISNEHLLAIRGRAEKVREYHAKAFYELEAQRATHKEIITKALQSVPGTTINIDGWCRAIKLRYVNTPLSCTGSLKQSGRFNYGADIDEQARFTPFPALYIASDRATAHCEMFGYTEQEPINGLTSEALALQPAISIVYLALSGTVNNVFDLQQKSILKPFLEATKKFKMTSSLRKLERKLGMRPMQVANTAALLMRSFMEKEWRAFPMHVDIPANSQIFARLVLMAGFEGIRYESTRTGKDALAIFPRNFRNSTSIIRVTDAPPESKCTVLNGETWGDAERTEW